MTVRRHAQGPAEVARPSRARRVFRALVGALAMLIGLLAIALGAALFLSARPAYPVRVDGTIGDYRAVFIGGSYARSELNLVNDPHTYIFNRGAFSPALPDRFYQDGQVVLWTDGVGGQVIALTLDDVHGLNAVTYSTLSFDNPQTPLWLGQSEGVGAAVMGLALAAGAPVLLALGSRRRATRRARAATSRRRRSRDSRPTDDTLPTLEQVAVEMPAVVIAGRAAQPSAPAAASAPHAAQLPAIDELPTARMPALSMPPMPRPSLPVQSAPPAERSNPFASGAMPDAPPPLPRFGPGGSPAGPDAGVYIPGDPWAGRLPATQDPTAPRPGTRLVPMEGQRSQPSTPSSGGPAAPTPGASARAIEETPTAPTPAVAPPPDEGAHAPRAPLWPPARDTNGQ